LPKPLTPVLGRPLISYTLDALASAELRKSTLSSATKAIADSAVKGMAPPGVTLSFVFNSQWQKQNEFPFWPQ